MHRKERSERYRITISTKHVIDNNASGLTIDLQQQLKPASANSIAVLPIGSVVTESS